MLRITTAFSFALLLAPIACSSATEPTPSSSPASAATAAPTGDPKPDDSTPPTPKPFTEAEVQALFDQRCTRCHDSDNALLDLTAFTKTTVGIKAGSAAAPARGKCSTSGQKIRIVPGSRNASLLYQKVKGTQDCGSRMPYEKGDVPFDATEVERLGLYIDGMK